MADANRLRNPAPTPVDDDPFAELTRIMGFDPRIPVKVERAAAQQSPVSPSQPEDDLDFGIDLEQELMGALAEPEPLHGANESQASARQFAAPQMEPVEYEPEDPQPAVQASYQPELDGAAYPQSGAAYPQSLDEEAYATAGDEPGYGVQNQLSKAYGQPGPSYEPAAEQELEEADHDDYRAEGDRADHAPRYAEDEAADASGPQAYASAPDDVNETDELGNELDDALASSLENEAFGDERDWSSEPPPVVQAQAESAPTAADARDEFAGSSDATMAKVDMDFSKGSPDDDWQSSDEDVADEDAVAESDEYFAQPELQASDEAQERYDNSSVSAVEAEIRIEQEPEPTVHDTTAHAADDAAERDSQSEIDDAIAELAAMVRGYERPAVAAALAQPVAPPPPPQVETEDEFLDIDTVDVPEHAVALADDLDIPEVHEAAEPTPLFDDLDAELAAAFGEPTNHEPAQPVRAQPASLPEFDLNAGYDGRASAAAASGAASYAATMSAMPFDRTAAVRGGDDIHIVRRDQQHAEPLPYADDFDVERDFNDDFELAGMPVEPQPRVSRRGLIVASVVGGIAVLGVVGALALSGGSGIGTGEPALVRADSDPIKIKPENPGGAMVANQESRVFDRAAGETAAQPDQEQLMTTEEEPVDVAARFPEEAPEPIDESADIEGLETAAPKGEDRIEQAIAQDQPAVSETVAVQPRKVRTMVVKPDGSLVAREETAPSVAQDIVGSTTAAGALTDPAVSAPAEATAEIAPPAGEDTAAPVASAEPSAAESAPAARATVPDTMPALPSRPAEQPVDIVGEVKPDQIASVAPNAAPAGSWSMQIASQPSEASAKSTYQDLSLRYGSVLSGRTANIVKADIAGKGTFWRIRVPAGSRNEAVSLCESYKSAGGNCFVSK